ncbi:ABC transporter ATP-binding protein [Cyclobacteriaceae bacterium]|jgi:putative ABC transport system ATP-binding protein|nr:ABC transporter ATP-binding protein [Cyclobacteriaceae bacterium]MDB4603166.1 ABC transporter ATP-binding protein [Cyclobacteriaceae bacterium]MDB9939209.1 ABC transporter ATP-binding protein [Cyclobacteriaceae bacterium]|tara:strand:- start:2487 stop:3155 length:669 start_codon:yes stop_codon:yes gene_type:complete
MSEILKVKSLSKVYGSKTNALTVLKDINFSVLKGESVAIIGPSGSGKTTLLGLCAGLDRVTEGEIILNHISLNELNEDELAQVRNQNIGFVFQNFQLIPTLTALENVQVPLELRGVKNTMEPSIALLERVGLGARKNHYPSQLSGGEQQRVAIARAFSNNPEILFADEPTGNLDEETGKSIEALLFEINKEKGTTLIIVTHDLELAQKTHQIIKIKGGTIIH